jgi:hypothetical protein
MRFLVCPVYTNSRVGKHLSLAIIRSEWQQMTNFATLCVCEGTLFRNEARKGGFRIDIPSSPNCFLRVKSFAKTLSAIPELTQFHEFHKNKHYERSRYKMNGELHSEFQIKIKTNPQMYVNLWFHNKKVEKSIFCNVFV